MKIALCLIVKPSDSEADVLYRLLTTEGLHTKFDGIFITITCNEGDKRAEKVKAVAEQAKAHISYFEWIDHFAVARNYNFSQVPKEYDWIMWTDADDIVKGSKHIRTILKKADDTVYGVYLPYLYDFDEYGECTVRHNKLRIIRNDKLFTWTGVIGKGQLHENLESTRQVKLDFCKDIQILHLTNHTRVNEAITRNVRISEKALKEDSKDARNWWNCANSTYMAGNFEKAIKLFFEFIQRSASDEEIYMSWDRIANIYFKMHKYEQSIEAALEALRIRPWYPNAFFTLAQSFYNARQFKHAKEMLEIGMKRQLPDESAIVWNPRDYDYNPLMLLAKTYYQLNQPHEAYKVLAGGKDDKGIFRKGLIDMFPKHKGIQDYATELKKVCDKLDIVDKICDKAKKCKKKEQIAKLLDNAPDELQSHPKLVYLRNIHFVKTKSSGKDLDIYCFETIEEWNPEIAKTKGIGGSEEAVLNMAPRLSELGWNVTVYNNCGYKQLKFGKVTWKPYWLFNYRDKRDVFIAWRHPLIFDYDVNAAKKYCWLHDTVSQNEFTNKRIQNITKIIPLSNWHRKLYPDIPNDKFMISSNGVDISQFENKDIKRDSYRLLYTSAPERGLDILLKLFPKIKKEVPEAELALFYGWNVWDTVYHTDLKQQEWKEEAIKLMKQPGVVTNYERITHTQIAKEYLKAGILAYPTEFTEINCISVQKAQIAGAIPVSTNVAALEQYNKWGIQIKGSDIYTNKKLQKEWIGAVVDLLKNPWKQEKYREKMIPLAKKEFNWENTVNQWHEEFIK